MGIQHALARSLMSQYPTCSRQTRMLQPTLHVGSFLAVSRGQSINHCVAVVGIADVGLPLCISVLMP